MALPDPAVVDNMEATTAIDYVAMGDSFSAGPFIGTYAHRPARGVRGRRTTTRRSSPTGSTWGSYTDVTCSAATTEDLYAPMTLFDGGTAPSTDRRRVGRHRSGDDRGI